MTKFLDILRHYRRIADWEKPATFKSITEVDFDESNPWTLARELIQRDPVLRTLRIVAFGLATLVILALGLVFLSSRADRLLLSGILMVIVFMGFPVVWGLSAARASDLAAGVSHGSLVLRALRAWPVLLPFSVLPDLVTGMIFRWITPVAFRLYGSGRQFNAGLLLIGRYWHYNLAQIVAGGRDETFQEGLAASAGMMHGHKSDLYDMVAEDKYRVFVPMTVFGVAILLMMAISRLTGESITETYTALALMGSTALWFRLSVPTTLVGMTWFAMVREMYAHEDAPVTRDQGNQGN